ncbi:MAG: DUF4835 family protein, partial [Melioribacteraceae bacterium]|nr:DUF4835 family protein [Melioribacteraceae bacterium]
MKKIILIFILCPLILNAQELRATVKATFEQLPTYPKERLVNFANEIEAYMNNTKFTDIDWADEDRIKCDFNIFFTAGSEINRYAAQIVITSQRPVYNSETNSLMLNVMDNSWQFEYEPGQAMYYNSSTFDGLTSFLDFYALIIIGLDMDSYEEFGGNIYFSKAFEITALGASSKDSEGWEVNSSSYSRRGLVENLMNANFEQFRRDVFNYHYNGLDYFFKYPKQTHKMIVKLVDNLYESIDSIDPRNVLLNVFFDSKSGEIIRYLKGYNDPLVFEKLKIIDPPHTSKYNEV